LNVLRFTPRCAVAEKARLCCDCWESSEDTEERVVGVLVDGSREKVCSCWGRTGMEKREEEKDLAETIAELVALVCSVNGLALECGGLSLVPCLGYLMLRRVHAYLFTRARGVDTAARMEGTALQRKPSIMMARILKRRDNSGVVGVDDRLGRLR
jgi:hypothetical protein